MIMEHLQGNLFDGGLRVRPGNLTDKGSGGESELQSQRLGLSRKGGRNAALLALSNGRKLLHMGCVDHPPLIGAKIEAGQYLHKLLVDHVADGTVYGLDNNTEGLRIMEDLGFENLYSNLEKLKDVSFETVLIPDTIEHLQNPGQFLEEVRSLTFQRVVLSVPNAYSLENRLFFRSESINSDHRTLHSPYSFCKLLTESGFEVTRVILADYWGPKRPLRALIKFLFPLTREHLIVEAKY